MRKDGFERAESLAASNNTEAWIPNLDRLKNALAKRDEVVKISSCKTIKDLQTATHPYEFSTSSFITDSLFQSSAKQQRGSSKIRVPREDDYSTTKESSQRRSTRVDLAAGVKTGDDVVEFYARYGHDSPVMFFYCNRNTSSVAYLPYELVVLPKEKVSATEYFTMSATGVMHIKKDSQAEFTPLSDWVHEKIMFGLLRKLRFYKFFFESGCFSHWLKTLRQSKFKRLRKSLSTKLFFSRKTYCTPLMRLHSSIHGLEKLNFCPAAPLHVYHLAEFVELHRESSDQLIKPGIEKIIERVQQGLEDLCSEVERTAHTYRDSIRDESELLDRTGVELFQGRNATKKRSMKEIRQEKIDRADAYYRVMHEKKLLGRFIRLIDTIFVEKLLARCLESTTSFLDLLSQSSNGSGKVQKGTFQTTFSFVSDGISFQPDVSAVLAAVKEQVIEGISVNVQRAPRLLFARGFGRYFAEKPSGLNALDMLNTSEKFSSLKDRIFDVVVEDFRKATNYASTFDEYKKIHEFGEQWDVNVFAKSPSLGVRDIRRTIFKQKEWRNDIDKMKLHQIVGYLFVETKTLKANLLPATERVLEELKQLLVEMAKDKCALLLKEFSQRIAQLKARPSTLNDFADYMTLHDTHVKEKKRYLKAAVEVDDMYDLLYVNEKEVRLLECLFQISTADQVRYDDFKEAVASFIEELKSGKEFIADHKQIQIEHLQNEIESTNEETVKIFKALNTGIFISAESEVEEVLSKLHGVIDSLSTLQNRMDRLRSYQALLDVCPEDFHDMERTKTTANTKFEIWSTLKIFTEKTERWLKDPLFNPATGILHFNVSMIQKEVLEVSNILSRLKKDNKEDRVLFRLKDRLDEFQTITPLLVFLLDSELTLHHWKLILNELTSEGRFFGENGLPLSFSVQDLIGLNLIEKLPAVKDSLLKSMKEHNSEEEIST